MSNATANAHLAIVPPAEPATQGTSPESRPARVALSQLDRLGLDGLLSGGDGDVVVAWAADTATELAGPDRDAARLRLISRAVAVEQARQQVLAAILDERLAARDLDAVATVNKILTSTTRRLCALLDAHARSSTTGQRPSVVIGQAVVHVARSK